MAADAEDTVAFATKLSKAYEQGFIVLGVEIGSRLGIFDYMMKVKTPLTCKEIADGLGLRERYVKEWLGVVVCGGIVDLSKGKFSIPAHRVPILTTGSPSNGTLFSSLVGMCGRVSEEVTSCFKLDGPKGVPYSKYPLFHQWREGVMNISFTKEAMLTMIGYVPGLLGKLEAGIEICDLGCSTGVAPFKFAETFPKTEVYGYDISEESTQFAEEKTKTLGLKNVHFTVQDCCKMPDDWSERFDFVFVYDVVHDVPRADKFLSEIQRILKPGCAAVIVDILMHTDMADNVGSDFSSLTYGISLFHCMPVSLHEDGLGLGTAWGIEKAEEMMKEAGFSKVEVKSENHAIYVCYK